MQNNITKFSLILLMLISLTSCELVGDILEVGIGIGIFIVVIVAILIFWIVRKLKR